MLVEEIAKQAGLPRESVVQMWDNGLRSVPVWTDTTRHAVLERFITEFGRRHRDVLTSLIAVIVTKTHLGPHSLCGSDALEWFSGGEMHDAVALEISGQPCAILHSGVQLAMKILARAEAQDKSVLVIGCDVAENADERCYFGSVMGDGCVAMLLNCERQPPTILESYTDINIIAPHGEMSSPDEIARFRANNVFWIRDAILAGLKRARRNLDEQCIIIPHTPNRHVIEGIRQALGISHNQMSADQIGSTGHLCSNDSFIAFARNLSEGRLENFSTAVLVNGGFGGARGVTVINTHT